MQNARPDPVTPVTPVTPLSLQNSRPDPVMYTGNSKGRVFAAFLAKQVPL